MPQTHDVNMPSSQGLGAEAGTALVNYQAGFDILINYSTLWQDLTKDFDDVRMFGSNTECLFLGRLVLVEESE